MKGRAALAVLRPFAAVPLGLPILQGASGSRPFPRFFDVSRSAGVTVRTTCGRAEKPYILDSIGTGVAVLDYDGDGDLDLYFPNGSRVGGYPPGEEPRPALYRHEGGWRFLECARAAGVDRAGWWQGCAVGDYDGDGRPDLLVTGIGSLLLHRNEGEGRFRDRSLAAGVVDSRWSSSAAFADFDADGDLDLYVATYVRYPSPAQLDPEGGDWCDYAGQKTYCGPQNFPGDEDLFFRNEGDGTFREVGSACGIAQGADSKSLGVVPADADGDGDLDLYVANDLARNFLFLNRGDAHFVEEGVLRGVGYGAEGNAQAGMGVDAGDFDGDGDFDLFVTNLDQESSTLYRNEGKGWFVDDSLRTGLERPSWPIVGWGTRFLDLDRDGDLDLVSANGHIYPQADRISGRSYRQPSHVYRNDGGRFLECGEACGPDLTRPRCARGLAWGDLDDDGDPDLVLTVMDDTPVLLRDDAPSGPSWIRFRLTGRRSAREGSGVRLEVRAGGRVQVLESRASGSFLSSSDPRPLFGLGGASRVESVALRWPSGLTEEWGPLEANRSYDLVEGSPPVPSSPR